MMNIRRKLFTAVATAGLVSLLSGCIKMDMDMKLSKDEKISGTMIVGFQKSLLEMMGQTKEEFLKDMKLGEGMPKGSKVKTYDKDGYVGQEVSFKDLPASELNNLGNAAKGATAAAGGDASSSSKDDLKLAKVNGKWVMSGTMDLSSAAGATGGAKPKAGEPDMSALMKGFKVRIKMTFPGKIVEHDKWGKVKDNSVEWNPKAGEKVVMKVVANAS
jgi:hypothetical protein